MKEQKISTDIFSAILSVFLSAALIILTVVLVLNITVSSFAKGNALGNAFKNLGSEIIKQEMPSVAKDIEKYGFKNEKFDAFLKSNAVKDIGKLYGKDFVTALQCDEKAETQFTKDNIKGAMVVNLSELIEIIDDKADEEQGLKIERKIVKTIRNGKCNIIKEVSTKRELIKEIDNSGFEDLIKFVSNPNSKRTFLIICLILAIAVFALRYYKFGGLAWIGTDLIFSAVILLVLIVLSLSGAFSMMFGADAITSAVIKAFGLNLVVAFVVVLAISISCYVAGNILKKKFCKGWIQAKYYLDSHFNEKRVIM